MYEPFVKACNYALHRLSQIQIEGLPACSDEKQIVFVRNHDKTVDSGSHKRKSLLKPDIALIGWKAFKQLSIASSNIKYSASYSSEICTSKPGVKPDWVRIRSTVEMKVQGLQPTPYKWQTYDKGFGALHEFVSPTPPVKHASRSEIMEEDPPDRSCECTVAKEVLPLICFGRWLPEFCEISRKERSPHGGGHLTVTTHHKQQAQAGSHFSARRRDQANRQTNQGR